MLPRGLSQDRRFLAGATAVVLALVGVIVWRVLGPSEVVTPATGAYPQEMFPAPGALGALRSAPLILDDRLRVFATKREVWADGPASYHYERSAYWSYRRWPAQVTGVLLQDLPTRPMVITAWSDGTLTAIDAEAGTVAWRAEGEPLAGSYTGRGTGADTVYTPTGLFTSGARVVTVSSKTISGYRSESGERLWQISSPVPSGCQGTAFTNQAQLFLLDTCAQSLVRVDTGSGATLQALPAAQAEPLSCTVGTSHCAAMRLTKDDRTTGWILTDNEPLATTLLARPGATMAGDGTVLVQSADSLRAIDLGTNQTLWTWRPDVPGPFRVLAADAARTLILEPGGTAAALITTTGKLLIRTSIRIPHDPDAPYAVSHSYVSGAHFTLVRTTPDIPPAATDNEFYFTNRPVLLVYTGPLE